MGYRLRFSGDKQRRFLHEAKERAGCTWKELAVSLRVDDASLWEWKEERRFLPEIVYQRLRWDDSYEDQIQEVLQAQGTQKHLRMPPKSEELAELLGIIMGDGNVSKYGYAIRIAGHAELDRDYLVIHVSKLLRKLFGVSPRIAHHTNPEQHAMYAIVTSKDIHEYVQVMGACQGNKVNQFQEIPLWVLQSDNYLKAYLRGLFDTDGSIFRMSNRDGNLLRINFTSYSTSLIFSVREALRRLGLHPSKPVNGGIRINLSRQNDVRKYLKEIGFANQKHIERYAQLSPVV